MKRIFRILSLFLLLTSGTVAMATHLVGGNLGYVYQGETAPGSNLYRYQVYTELYMNCGPNSNFQTFQDLLFSGGNNGFLHAGVYSQDPLDPNADKTLETSVDLALVSEEQIIPDFPDGCSIGAGLCTLKGLFVGTVDLPLSFSGYHLYMQLGARNLDIDNLFDPNQTGIGFYAFVPPTLVNNSSPIWFGIPTPFLCTSDTTSFVNSASDPDGDQLVFSFETPYDMVFFTGGVQQPPNTLTWPVPEVPYNPGFSVDLPFGLGGYSFINGATGFTQYQPQLQGNYVVAVEVKEFRNGQLIGITRRDLQLQAVICPPNNTPAVNGPLPLTYTVDEGAQLCFNMNFNDVDVDSLFLSANGTIFDINIYNPPATVTPINLGVGNAGAQFCWPTSCDQGQDQPYLFSVSVVDNGCPPKNVDVVFQVNVVPFTGPDDITGPLQVCTGQTGTVYSTDTINGAVFTWIVNGGSITSGQGSNSITVDWGTAGAGSVLVNAVNSLGCTGDQVSISVNIAALPAASAGNDITICLGDTVTIGGSPTGPVASSYTWTPAISLNNGALANPDASPTSTTDYIVQVSNTGCIARDTVRVTVSIPVVNAGNNVSICAGDTAQLQATGTGSVLWSPPAGLSATNILDPLAFPATSTLYIVTLTDNFTCVAQDTVRVTVNPLPVVDAGLDSSACVNENTVLGGSPTGPAGSTFLWSPALGLNNATSANPVATITTAQTWIVTVTDTNACVNSDAVTITALAIPSVDAGADTSICAGQSVQLNGSGSGTLLWSPIFGLSDPTIGNPSANPEATVTYTLTVTGGNFCINTDQTTVTVNVLPNANAGPDLAVCLGDSVQIQATGPGSYSWTPAATLNNAFATNPIATPLVTTTYVLTLTDSLTCVREDSMVVSVSIPSNAGTNGSTTICGDGLSFGLFNLLGGSPQVGGTWSGPDGAPSDGFYTPGTSLPGGYIYSVSAPSPCAPDTSIVTVIETPEADAGESVFLPICSNSGAVDLFTVLGGTPNSGGTWTDENNLPFNGIFDPATNTSQVFTYLVLAALPCSDDQAQVTVIVTTAPDPGSNASVSTCLSGLPFVLTDSLGGTPDSGVWTDPSNVAHSDTFNPATDANGDWTYTVAGTGGCADTTSTLSISVTVPNTDITGNNTICAGDTTQLVNVGNVSWAWSPIGSITDPTIGDPLFFPSQTTSYTVFVTDASGCTGTGTIIVNVNQLPVVDAGADVAVCDGQGTTIGGSPTGPLGSTFSWSPVSGLGNTTDANPDAQPLATTTYTVVVTDVNQCMTADDVTVTWNALPAISAGPDTSFCLGGSVQLNATGAGQFIWSPVDGLSSTTVNNPIASASTTITYTVSLTDANNCVNSDEVLVVVNGLPNADAGPDKYLCPGFDVQLNGSGGGSANWSPNDGTLNNSTVPNPLASPVVATTYTLTITDGNGCSDSDDTQVLVSSDPPVDAGPDQNICAGQQVILGGNPTNIPGTSVNWSPVAGLSDTTASNPTVVPTETTQYLVTVTSDTCTNQDMVLITVQDAGVALFTVRLEPGCEKVRAFFTDQSLGASQWLWNFGDGGTSNEQNPQHYFAYGAPITATLTVTDLFGCSGSITQVYEVSSFDDYVDYQIPNVFTPNGDGKNDVFTFNTNGILGPCTSMQVFNRWGQKVFDSFGNDIVWTGRNFAGEECVNGTYFYTITLKEMSFNGNVYLNR